MPDYGYEEAGRRKAKKEKVASEIASEWTAWQNKEASKQTTINTPIKIEITRGDMTIKVELTEVEQATNLITTIMKGE